MSIAICPGCGRSDAVRPSPQPFSEGDLLGTLMFGWLGYWSAESERRSILRCDHCGCRFRKPTGFLGVTLIWLIVVATIGAGTFIAVAAAVHSTGFQDQHGRALLLAALEQPEASLAAAGAMLLASLLSVWWLACRLRTARRALLQARGSLRAASGGLSPDARRPSSVLLESAPASSPTS